MTTPNNRISIAALGLIFLFGVDSMYGLIYRNGYLSALIRIFNEGPFVLPGSDIPILTKYCGLASLDKTLTLASITFANIKDGSTPQLSLCAFQFAGQLVPLFMVIMIEGKRRGNQGTAIAWSLLWGSAIQCLGYGVIMPIYAVAHLVVSGTADDSSVQYDNAVRTLDLTFLRTLIPSMIFGYITPSILMTIPMFSSALHQWLGGVWQGTVTWMTLLQYAFGFWYRFHQNTDRETGPNPKTDHSTTSSRNKELIALKRAYCFAFGVATFTQLTTYTIVGARKFLPSRISPALNFRDVFLPPNPYSKARMVNMAIGAHGFFQYDQYVGSTAAIVWAVAVYCNSQKRAMASKQFLWLAAAILGLSAIAGPGGALVWLMWQRDNRLIGDATLCERKEK